MVLNQLLTGMKGKVDPDRFKDWRKLLADGVAEKLKSPGANKPVEDGDIHPLRLCEEINNFIARDAILVVDGQEVLNFGRQSMQTHAPGHRLNSGPFGTMGAWAYPSRDGHSPFVNLALGALKRRADVLCLVDVVAIAAERLGHLLVTRVAEVAPRLFALRVGGPTAARGQTRQARQAGGVLARRRRVWAQCHGARYRATNSRFWW